MKKVLITGITGFVGNHLTDHLLTSSSDIELFGTTRSLIDREDSTFSNVKLLHADFTDQNDVSKVVEAVKPDEVYHLAALSSPAESFNSPNETIVNNVSAEVFLLEALRHHELLSTKVMVVSSSDVYGFVQPEELPIDEDTPFRPGNPYAVSKIAQDYLALQYFLSYKMPIVRVRPFPHAGPKQTDKFVIANFAKQIAVIEKGNHEPVLKVGNLEAKRDFTDVRDMVRAYTLLMEKGEPGEVYNIGSGKSTKIIDIVNTLMKLSTISITTKIDSGRMRPSDTPDLYCNYEKMHQLTGWKPEIPLEQTLKDTLEYWRSVV